MARGHNIWVIGGTGFIGSALVRELSKDPKNRLHVLVHRNFPFRALEHTKVFRSDLGSIDPAWFERFPPDHIFHLGRIAGSRLVSRRRASLRGEQANRRLLGILSKLPAHPVVTYVSGSLMYGEQAAGASATEESALLPSAFASDYFRAERPWLEAREREGLDIRFVRPPWIVGTSSWFQTFFWSVFRQTGRVPIYGDGGQLMSLIHIDDCARMIASWAFDGKPGQDLNIFGTTPVDQRRFSETMAALLDTGTYRRDRADLPRRQQGAAYEALCGSIPLATIHEGFLREHPPQFDSAELILRDILPRLNDV